MRTKTILSFGAHPDDIEIGCGGTEAVLRREGHRIVHAVMTSGEAGGKGISPSELARIRESEAQAAAQVLGAKHIEFFRYPDGLTGFTREMKTEVIRLLRRIRPDTVFVHSSEDHFPDHKVVHELVMSALLGAAGPWYPEIEEAPHDVPEVLGYEVWNPIPRPQTFVDISPVIEKKRQAIRCYRSQLEPIAYDEAFMGLARYRGGLSSKGGYAEAFEVLKCEILPC